MKRMRAIAVVAVMGVAAFGTTGCELYDSDGNGVYDSWEIEGAVWRWWNCDVLGSILGDLASWSCNPHF